MYVCMSHGCGFIIQLSTIQQYVVCIHVYICMHSSITYVYIIMYIARKVAI